MTENRVAMSQVGVRPGMAERAREFAEGRFSPPVPRDAATVVLLRQAPDAEVFLLRRIRTLKFAPGACVFPGGSVDEGDADRAIAWAGPSPAEFGDRLGTSPEHARALVCAAVRETFEESGVLLAGPSPTAVLPDSAALAQDRRALLNGSVSLGDLLSRRGLVVRADLLTPWARWITPEVEPRRFDTWFFATALPPGQAATLAAEDEPDPSGPDTLGPDPSDRGPGESDSGIWLRPSAALDAARAGEITLLPPTAVTLAELAAHQDVASILAARRTIAPLLPKVVVEDGQAWLAMPWATEYPLLYGRCYMDAVSIDGFRTPRATCLLAPNPSPLTLDGTNTWLIAEPGSSSVVVVDPGPDDDGHLRRVLSEATAGDRRVAKILLTHGHPDHSAGAARLAELSGAPVQAALGSDPAHRLGSEGLADGDVVTAAGGELRVLATPGHSADSVCLLLAADGVLLTGDTVLGRGTAVIAPDGNLGEYLRTLGQLRELAGAFGVRMLLPGHGPMLADPIGTLDYYLSHRAERLDQVRSALAAGARTPAEIVAMIYTDVDPSVWPAAQWSVRAQLDYLAGR